MTQCSFTHVSPSIIKLRKKNSLSDSPDRERKNLTGIGFYIVTFIKMTFYDKLRFDIHTYFACV